MPSQPSIAALQTVTRTHFMASRYFAGFSPLAAIERAISFTARASAVAALMIACDWPSARERSSCPNKSTALAKFSCKLNFRNLRFPLCLLDHSVSFAFALHYCTLLVCARLSVNAPTFTVRCARECIHQHSLPTSCSPVLIVCPLLSRQNLFKTRCVQLLQWHGDVWWLGALLRVGDSTCTRTNLIFTPHRLL